MTSCRSAQQSHTPRSCSQRWRPSRSSKMSSRLPLLPSPPPCRPVAPPLPRSMAESRMAMGGAEGGVEATEEERGERTRTRSGRRRVEETSHTTPMEPPSPPRSTGCSRRLVRRRGLCLQATTGCFLQNQRRRDEPRRRVVRALSQVTRLELIWDAVVFISQH